MTESTDRPVVVDMFCGSGGESQGIDWAAGKADVCREVQAMTAVCPRIAEALTAGYMRELKAGAMAE